jgi:succinate dehydrogenase / fumarate reductase flavoprotein subunit
MYEEISGDNPYKTPMMIYPAPHYTMGGLWVDYYLQSTIPGLIVAGEANFSDHGANRLGASALMQGLCDGYFVVPPCVGHYIGSNKLEKVTTDHPEFDRVLKETQKNTEKLLSIKGKRTVLDFHRSLGKIMWDNVGMARERKGLENAIREIQKLRTEFWQDVKVPGTGSELNKNLEMAGRVADFIELAELMAIDALNREESCGGHFRVEHATTDGEAERHDDKFSYVAAWEFGQNPSAPKLHKEELVFEFVKPGSRSYK